MNNLKKNIYICSLFFIVLKLLLGEIVNNSLLNLMRTKVLNLFSMLQNAATSFNYYWRFYSYN